MSRALANFLTSPYFVPEPNNWHLLPSAPEEIVKSFEEFMANEDPKPQEK